MRQILIQKPINIGKIVRMIYYSTINVRSDKGYSDLKVVYYAF